MGSSSNGAGNVLGYDVMVPTSGSPEKLLRKHTKWVYAVEGKQRTRDSAPQATDSGRPGHTMRPAPDSAPEQMMSLEGDRPSVLIHKLNMEAITGTVIGRAVRDMHTGYQHKFSNFSSRKNEILFLTW